MSLFQVCADVANQSQAKETIQTVERSKATDGIVTERPAHFSCNRFRELNQPY